MADTPARDRALGLRRTRVGGRFVPAYSPELGLEICEKIAEGATLIGVCRDKSRYPSRQTFHRWVVNNPELARAYAAARELSSYALEEEALDAAREIKNNPQGSVFVQAFNAHMAQLRWSAARRNPRVFSERGAIQITVPVQINTPLDMGSDIQNSTAPDHPNVYLLEAHVETPVENEGVPAVEAMQEGESPLVPERPVGRPKRKSTKKPSRPRKRSRKIINADTKA